MKDCVFEEIRKVNTEMRALKKKDAKVYEKESESIIATIVELKLAAELAKRDGILALECHSEFEKSDAYFKEMLICLCDGYHSEELEEILLLKYFAGEYSTLDKMKYLIRLYGVLEIQQMTSGNVIENKVLAMLSEDLVDKYKKSQENENYNYAREEIDHKRIEKYYVGDLAVTSEDSGYYSIKTVDALIKQLDQTSLKKLLWEVENKDLAEVMRVISGEARKKVFDALSERMAYMLAIDMDSMGAVPLDDVVWSAARIIGILNLLVERDVILAVNEKALGAWEELLERKENLGEMEPSKLRECELQKVLREYLSHEDKLIYPHGES